MARVLDKDDMHRAGAGRDQPSQPYIGLSSCTADLALCVASTTQYLGRDYHPKSQPVINIRTHSIYLHFRRGIM